jgi:putative peptidoglycan lipid II flippase
MEGVAALAMGLLVGTTIQVAVILILAERRGIRCRPTPHLNPPGIRQVARSILILSSGVLIVQIGPVVDQVVSSWLPVGSLSAINYSLKIIGIPSSLLFVSVSRVLLPRFSTLVAVGDIVALKRSFRSSVWIVGGLTLIISIVFIVFSKPIVRVLYQRGSFDEAAVQATAGALIGFSVGLVPMGIGFLAPRVFNALNRNSILARLALVTFVINFVLDVVLSHYFLQIGIALSTSITYAVTTSIMLILLGRSIGGLGLLPSLTMPRRAVSKD